MCGLTSIASSFLTKDELSKFSTSLFLNYFRGVDSTGVAGISKGVLEHGYSVKILKANIPVTKFIALPEYTKFMGMPLSSVFGHTRAATKGDVNHFNAHPFVSQKGFITGVHNGTLRDKWQFKDDFETDSEALINIIETEGIEGLKKVSGAFALIWYDSRTKTLYHLNNGERDLFYYKKGQILLASSSEEWSLRRSFKLSENDEVIKLPPWTLLKAEFKETSFDNNTYKSYSLNTTEEKLEAPFLKGGRFHEPFLDEKNWIGNGWKVRRTSSGTKIYVYDENFRNSNNKQKVVDGDETGENQEDLGVPFRCEPGEVKPDTKKETSKKNSKIGTAYDLIELDLDVLQTLADNCIINRFYEELGDGDFNVSDEFPDLTETVKFNPITWEFKVETTKDSWLDMEEFCEILDTHQCSSCLKTPDLYKERKWVSQTEFLCEDCKHINIM